MKNEPYSCCVAQSYGRVVKNSDQWIVENIALLFEHTTTPLIGLRCDEKAQKPKPLKIFLPEKGSQAIILTSMQRMPGKTRTMTRPYLNTNLLQRIPGALMAERAWSVKIKWTIPFF